VNISTVSERQATIPTGSGSYRVTRIGKGWIQLESGLFSLRAVGECVFAVDLLSEPGAVATGRKSNLSIRYLISTTHGSDG
jgi:hypothetical protein